MGAYKQHSSFISSVGATDVVQPHGKPQHVLDNVQFDFFLLLFFFNVSKPISTFIAHFAVAGSGAPFVVDFLEIRNLVVEVLKIGLGVQAKISAVLNGVAQGVLRKWSSVPTE